jgi:hypothetical protein
MLRDLMYFFAVVGKYQRMKIVAFDDSMVAFGNSLAFSNSLMQYLLVKLVRVLLMILQLFQVAGKR